MNKESDIYKHSEKNFFLVKEVGNCCFPHIKQTFDTLLLQKKVKQQELADYLQIDKADCSRMVHGKLIPSLRIRLKVAKFFNTDSGLIWRQKDESK